MRKNKLALPLLVLLLIVGGAIGAFFVMQDTGGGNGPDVGQVDDGGQDGPADGQDPDLLGVDGGDEQTPPEKQPGNGGDTTNNNNGGGESNATNNNAGNGNGESNTTNNNGGETTPEAKWSPVEHDLTITGRVRFKSDGTPAVGADVTAEEAEDTNVNWRGMVEVETFENKDRPKMKILGRTTTDGAGEFTLTLKVTTWQRAADKDATPEGDREAWGGSFGNAIRVIATMAGYAPARSNNIFLGGQSEQRVELELAVPTLLRGRVVDAETRQGIAGARGSLFDTEGAGRGLNSRSFVTDENGYFVINDLPESTWGLTLNADGYASWNGWENVGRLILKGGEERDLGEITMQRAAGVTGKVVDAETGEAIAMARVSVEAGGRWGGGFSEVTTTREDGSFEITGVEPGTYAIKARADGYAQTVLEAQAVEPGKGLDVGVIKLGTGISINGRVNDGRGTPVAEAVVKISEPREGFSFGPDNSSLQSTASDAEGFYQLSGLSEGSFTLTVTAEGYAEYTETVTIEGEGQRIDVTLQMGGTITGRVLDSKGTPVQGANVAAVDHESQAYTLYKMQPSSVIGMAMWGGAVSAQTDESGRFELANVPAGTYLLVSSKEGSSAFKDDLKVENERTLNAGDLRFAGNGSVRVIVTEDGQRVPDLEVSLTQGMGFGGGGGHSATTDSTGTALIEDVPAGTYYITTARDEGGFDTERRRHSVKVKSDETVQYELELRPKDGVHLHGRLTMNGEATLETVMLVGKGERNGIVKSTETERGYYEFVGVKPGLYTLFARESDTAVACRVELDLTKEGDHPFERDFKGYEISGAVSTPENTAAQFTATQLTLKALGGDDGAFSSWLSGRATPVADGSFEFPRVPPGRYRLTATLEGVGSTSTEVEILNGAVTGLSLGITNNSGSVKVTVSKLNGSAVAGGGFGTIELTDSQGRTHEFADPQQSFMMISEGAAVTASTVAPGTWKIEVRGSGFVTQTIENVQVKKGETTEINVELTAAAALYLTASNSEITQEMFDNAQVRYFDAQGAELAVDSNVFDTWMGAGETPEDPTLAAHYIGMDVSEVRIKLEGYVEVVIPVEPTPGKKIEKQETFILE